MNWRKILVAGGQSEGDKRLSKGCSNCSGFAQMVITPIKFSQTMVGLVCVAEEKKWEEKGKGWGRLPS